MTLLEMYNKIAWLVYGDTAPPASFATNMQGENGFISDAHRQIQRDFLYWFMYTTASQILTSGTSTYNFPCTAADLKEIGAIIPYDSDGAFSAALGRMTPSDAKSAYPDPTGVSEIPLNYTFDVSTYTVYPEPNDSTVYLLLQYWQFLPRLTGNTDTDALTVEGAWVIIYKVAIDACIALDYMEKLQTLPGRYAEALNSLRTEDWSRKRGGMMKVDRNDF